MQNTEPKMLNTLDNIIVQEEKLRLLIIEGFTN